MPVAYSPNDIAIRQQIYLEGVKNHEADKGNEIAGAFIAAILLALSKVGVENLYELNKKQFNSFLVAVRKQLNAIASRYRKETEKILRTVAKSDYAVTKAIFKYLGDSAFTAPRTTVADLWARIKNERVSGTGDLPLTAVASYYAGVVAYLMRLVQQNYSNKDTIAALIRALKGTPSLNYRDGAASRFYRQFAALIETIIQHGSSVVNQWLGRLVSDQYIWLSVLDSNTTDICRGRNGQIYRYGEGPQPPAHYRCRSRTRPYFAAVPTVPRTFYEWITTQPKAFLADVFGARTAGDIIAKRVTAAQMPKYENALRLSPEQYKDKVSLILT